MLGGPQVAFSGGGGGGGSGGGISPGGQWASGYWYGPQAGNTTRVVRGVMYFVPFPVLQTFPISGIAIGMFTGKPTSVGRLGIYVDTGHGKPGALLYDFGTVPTTGSTKAPSIAVSEILAPGQYWLVFVRQGAHLGTGNTAPDIISPHSDNTTMWGIAGPPRLYIRTNIFVYGWVSNGSTFLTALPSQAPAVAPVINTGPTVKLVRILLKAA